MISAFESYYSQSFAASPTAPETDNVAYLKSDIKTRDAVLSIQDKRIAELEAELLALKTQEPFGQVAFYQNNSEFVSWPLSPYLDNAKDCKTVYLAAGAQETKKIKVMTEADFDEAHGG